MLIMVDYQWHVQIYNTWIKRFPRDEALHKEKLNIKWDKPVKIFIKVDCLE